MTGADGNPRSPGRDGAMPDASKLPESVRDALPSSGVHLVYHEKRERRDFERGSPVGSVGLDRRIAAHLEKAGLSSLHRYQEDAIRLILGGHSVVIEAPTAAGKTVAFLAPVAHTVAESKGRGVRALFAYSTNALARDQFQEMDAIAKSVGRRAKIMNGDTDSSERKRLEADPPNILLTTFDFLHTQMAGHGPLSRLLGTVKILVADEAHFYNGLLGSNVHHVIARLKRMSGSLLCIAASATLKNSGEFCSSLFGQEMRVVRGKGQLATMDFAMLAPSVPAEGKGEARTLRHGLMADIAKRTASRKNRTILFSNSRKGAEIVGVLARDAGLRVGIHHSGMHKDALDEIERDFREGRLDAISCTPTLELGINIGAVGTVISELVPINRLMQRIGRAGRKRGCGSAFLVLGIDPMSQYYRRNPKDYTHDEWEPYIDPKNRKVEDIHTVSMATDRPLSPGEAEGRRRAVDQGIRAGLLTGEVLPTGGQTVMATPDGEQEARSHRIRKIGKAIRVVCGKEDIGERNHPHAIGELHPGALYTHNGRPYRIESLDLGRLRAEASPVSADLRMQTIALVEKRVKLREVLDSKDYFGSEAQYCEVEVELRVRKYIEKSYRAKDVPAAATQLERGICHTFRTNAVRLWAPRPLASIERSEGGDVVAGAYHAIGHVLVEASRMIIGVSRSDMDSESCPNGVVYVYDSADGGNGASKELYAKIDRVVSRAIGILGGCGCSADVRGCIHCTFFHRCGKENAVLHKRGALESLERLACTWGDAGS